MPGIVELDFMRNALLAALLVGIAAPMVGIYLLQRRLSLIGEGMGHVALAGVAIGVLLDTQPIATAMIAAVASGIFIEVVRARGRTSADVALALMFYGGLAAGVVIINRADGSQTSNLTDYLFGAITTTSSGDLVVFGALSAGIVALTLLLRQRLFAVASDEEYARASGMPVLALNIILSAMTAVTIVVAMRVVGLLLISALMIVPNAAAQQLARSFGAAIAWAVGVGVISSVGGVVTSYYADTATGGTIVLVAIAIFLLAAIGAAMTRVVGTRAHRIRERPSPPPDPGRYPARDGKVK